MDSKRIKDDITGRKVWQVIVRDTIWTRNLVIASVFSSEGDAEMFADNECLKLFKESGCEYSEFSHAIDKNRLLENISAFHHIDFVKFIKARILDDGEKNKALWYTVLDFVKVSPKVSLPYSSHAIDKNRLLENISAFHHIDFMKFIKARLVDDDEETEETEALWYTVLEFVKESPKVSIHTFIDWEEAYIDPPYHVTIEEVRIK